MKKVLLPLLLLAIVQIASFAQVVINEIMYNPPEPGTDTLEFIELLNAGNAAVDLEAYTFSSGIAYTFASFNLNPGGYLIICKNAQRMMEVFGMGY